MALSAILQMALGAATLIIAIYKSKIGKECSSLSSYTVCQHLRELAVLCEVKQGNVPTPESPLNRIWAGGTEGCSVKGRGFISVSGDVLGRDLASRQHLFLSCLDSKGISGRV